MYIMRLIGITQRPGTKEKTYIDYDKRALVTEDSVRLIGKIKRPGMYEVESNRSNFNKKKKKNTQLSTSSSLVSAILENMYFLLSNSILKRT